MKKLVVGSIVLVLIVVIAFVILERSPGDAERVPVIQSTPLADDEMVIEQPLPDSVVTSPFIIRGRARGTWFFEASFPVVLTDWDGRIIAEGIVTAQSDWMTEELVPFEGELLFTVPAEIGDFSRRGSLIVRKDNPSGLPEHDDAREMTVFFW